MARRHGVRSILLDICILITMVAILTMIITAIYYVKKEPVNQKKAKYYGLPNNTGTCCFLNSAIQVLYHNKPIRESVLRSNTEDITINNLKQYFQYLNNPSKFVGRIEDFTDPLITSIDLPLRSQQCSNEALRVLFISIIENNLLSTEIVYGSTNTYRKCKVCGTEKFYQHTPRDAISSGWDDTPGIEMNIEGVIDIFFKDDSPEILQMCNNCQVATYHKGVKYLSELPQILPIYISRTRWNNETNSAYKNNSKVVYGEKIEISKHIQNSNEKVYYNLKCVIVHSGLDNRGHYYCYIKIDGVYWKFNDSSVSKASEKEAITDNFGTTSNDSSARVAHFFIYTRD